MPESRLDQLREHFPDHGIDALMVTSRPDIQYLSGFRGSAGTLLISDDEGLLISDFRYRTQAADEAPGWEFIELASGKATAPTVADLIRERSYVRVGFQADACSYDQWDQLNAILDERHPSHLVPTRALVTGLRTVKDEEELALLQTAAEIADATMRRAFDLARPGVTERALQAELEYFMLQQGAEEPSFRMILAGGPHSALPHAPITERALQLGDLLTVDLGARYHGYCSDLTRTVAIGDCDEGRREIYRLVYRAQMAALEAVAAGTSGQEIDKIARTIIADGGHGEHFGHALGHGVGIEIHEGPRLAATAEKPLRAGQVVTVEPGVYVPDFGGVRIEDLVVVTEDGCRLLSQVEKTPEVMVLPA